MNYSVLLCPRARRQYEALPSNIRQVIFAELTKLGENQHTARTIAMQGVHRSYRIRTGDYRIVYTIHERTITIMVLEVANRREAYRGSDIETMDRDAKEWLADQDIK